MTLIHQLLDIFLHLDKFLPVWSQSMGAGLYVVLFAVIFCETGLVVAPFLPGDSLLLAVGALTALPDSAVKLPAILALLIVAAVLGDAANYAIGRRLGPAVFSREDSWLLNKKHLLSAQEFYERHGGKTIIIARFAPILRTFAPFVAGIGKMSYRRFASYNVVGGVAWVATFLVAGHLLGNVPAVKSRFHLVIGVVILVSLLPVIIEVIRARSASKAKPAA